MLKTVSTQLALASDTLSEILAKGNTSGPNNIIMDAGYGINGTLGATTPATVAATTLTTSDIVGIKNSNPSDYNAVGSNTLVVGTNVGNNGITVVGATTGYSSLAFADSAGSGGNDDYAGLIQYSHITNGMNFFTNSTPKMTLTASGNLAFVSGNGIDFSATAGTGTSELLDDYEEGTWTPTDIGGALVVVGTFSSSGTYTKIGKVVTVSGTLNGTTSVAITGGANVVCGGLPYSAAATLCPGSAVNAAASATASLYANSNVNVGSVTAMAATPSIFFSITYFV
jgi:hypothetical protein